MSREEVAQRLLVLRALKKAITDAEAELDTSVFSKPGQREVGDIGGRDLGSVQLIKGVSSWTVADQDAWVRWVQKHRPDEIVPAVRTSYRDAVLADLKAGRTPVDEDTGEILVPDGIAPKSGQPSIRVSPSKDAPQIVIDALGDLAVTLGIAVRGELEP